MNVTTAQFIIFFAVVCGVYFSLPARRRWMWLLLASTFFYVSWRPVYLLLLLLLLTFINYYAGIQMGKCEEKSRRKKFLLLSLFFNLGILFIFKYYDFFMDSLGTAFHSALPFRGMNSIDLVLPVGISFYTFKNLTYSIDLYRGNQKPERHIGIYALYLAFFPQILAGPIERSSRLIPQLHQAVDFDGPRVTNGLKLIFWGFFQKMVIADTLAVLVDPVYSHPSQYQGISLTVASLFFAVQIFCDFSGYSDIAIGAAKVLGYHTMDNFKWPYLSESVSEFWRRWHISLSSWFRDYLYIPLGGNRVSVPRYCLNLMIVFLVCGLWHGASWTFVIWGGLHGTYLVVSTLSKGFRGRMARAVGMDRFPRTHRLMKVAITFFWVCLAWIFFRASSVSDAFYILSQLPTGWGGLFHWQTLKAALFFDSFRFQSIVGIASAGLIVLTHVLQGRGRILDLLSGKPVWFQWSVYYAMALAFILLGSFRSKEFIYFQF